MKDTLEFIKKHSDILVRFKDSEQRDKCRYACAIGYKCCSLIELRILTLRKEVIKKGVKEARQMLTAFQSQTSGDGKEETSTPSPIQPSALASPGMPVCDSFYSVTWVFFGSFIFATLSFIREVD